MPCPYCEHEKVLYGATKTQHALRVLLGSQKRYCPKCQQKWRIKVHRHVPGVSGRELALILVAVCIGFAVFYFLSNTIGRPIEAKPVARSKSRMMNMLQRGDGRLAQTGLRALQSSGGGQAELMSKAKQMMGGNLDPSSISAKDRERLMKKASQYM